MYEYIKMGPFSGQSEPTQEELSQVTRIPGTDPNNFYSYNFTFPAGTTESRKIMYTTALRREYAATLSPTAKATLEAEVAQRQAIQNDLWARERETKERKFQQSAAWTIGSVVGVGIALPILSGILSPTATVPIADLAGGTAAESGLAAGTISGAAAVPAAGFWDAASGAWKAVTGGIDTLAKVLPSVEKIWNTFETVLGREDQPTMPVTQNKSTAPSSAAPIINLSIPPQSTGGIVLATTPAAEQPNYMLYAGIGILAIILLKGL